MNTASKPMYKWETVKWPQAERTAYKLQKRIYRAAARHFKAEDRLEIDHLVARREGGREVKANFQLLHRYCHVWKTAQARRRYACPALHD